MSTRRLLNDENATDKVIVIALVSLLTVSVVSVIAYVGLEDEANDGGNEVVWIDPVVEIEDENHSHSDLLAHRLQTDNMLLIDYHNLNCDGNVAPPAELDTLQDAPASPNSRTLDQRQGTLQRFPLKAISWKTVKRNLTERVGATLTFRPTISSRFLIFQSPTTSSFFPRTTLKSAA